MMPNFSLELADPKERSFRTPLHDPPVLSLDLGDSSQPRWFLTWLPQKAVVGPMVGEGGASSRRPVL
jgi:hypothetical protein